MRKHFCVIKKISQINHCWADTRYDFDIKIFLFVDYVNYIFIYFFFSDLFVLFFSVFSRQNNIRAPDSMFNGEWMNENAFHMRQPSSVISFSSFISCSCALYSPRNNNISIILKFFCDCICVLPPPRKFCSGFRSFALNFIAKCFL